MIHVTRAARRYPGVWFVGGHQTAEALADLADRVYFRCDCTTLRRLPFMGRDPFGAYAHDQMTHRQIATLTFYMRRSITRELMRGDYEYNLSRDPVARWQAEQFRTAGEALRLIAEPIPQRRGPPLWRLVGRSDRTSLLAHDVLVARLRLCLPRDAVTLVRRALELCGALSQAQLASVLQAVLPLPTGHPGAPAGRQASNAEGEGAEIVALAPEHAAELRVAVRHAVWAAWLTLEPDDRRLLATVARGASYAEIGGPLGPEVLRKRLAAICAVLHQHLARAFDGVGAPALGPVELAELVYAVIDLIHPEHDMVPR